MYHENKKLKAVEEGKKERKRKRERERTDWTKD